MTTARERVKVSIEKALELLGQLHEARAEVTLAKAAEDEVRLTDPTPGLTAEAQRAIQETTQQAESLLQTTVASARKPVEQAQVIYNAKVGVATEARTAAVANIQAEWDRRLVAAKKEQEMRAVVAQADVHTERQKVTQLEAVIEQHRRQVQSQLGIDLNVLIKASQE